MTTAGPDLEVARHGALPLLDAGSLDPLLDRIGDAPLVLLGGSPHTTEEYRRWREELTGRLVREKGFSLLAVADDRPYQPSAGGWWNAFRTLSRWLREHQPEHLRAAGASCSALEHCLADPGNCSPALALAPPHCAQELTSLLVRRWLQDAASSGTSKADTLQAAEGAHLPGATAPWTTSSHLRGVRLDAAAPGTLLADGPAPGASDPAGLEHYYRTLVEGGPPAWNLHQRCLADALDRSLTQAGRRTRAVVWAPDAQVGDARGTGRGTGSDLLSLGRLVRQRYGADQAVLIGFSAYTGTVMAADHWWTAPEVRELPPARPGSIEDRLHATLRQEAALFVVPAERDRPGWLREPVDRREIGAVYHPERESDRDYLPTVLGQRFDVLFHLDWSTAPSPPHGPHP